MSDAGETEFSQVGPQIIFAMDDQGRCTLSVGPALEAIGLESNELVGSDLHEIYRDDPVILPSIVRALAGETFTVSQEIEGRQFWTYFQAVHDADGAFTGSLGVTTDVTDQRRAEAEARAGRARTTVLNHLSAELTRGAVDPEEVLRTGVRVATEAFADIGVIWLLDEQAETLQPRVAWHADPVVREHLDRAVADVRGWQGWLDAAAVAALDAPLAFDLGELTRDAGVNEAQSLLTRLGLRHGLRLPVRSRGRVAGLLDFARGVEEGPFTPDDIGFGVDVADRFTLAYDNALLLAEQRAAVADLMKFKALAEASGELIALADVGGTALYVNPQVAAAGIELSADNLLQTVVTYVDDATAQDIGQALASGGRWTGDLVIDIGESRIDLRAEVFPLADTESGAPLGTAWMAANVTALRDTERALRAAVVDLTRFQALAEASRDFIAMSDLDGHVVYVNPAGRALIGIPSSADVRGTTIADYLTAGGLERALTVQRPVVLEQGHWDGESTLRDLRGGPPIPVAVSTFSMYDVDTGLPFARATVQRDITERRAADRMVRELAEQRQALLAELVSAQEAERAQIAADVHDDPVQALAAVDLRLGLLQRRLEEQAPQLLETLGPVQDSVARATDRLRVLLFDLETPELTSGLGPALERLAQEILKDTGVRVIVDAAAEPVSQVSTRAVAYRIVREALINVRKHAQAATVMVTVTGAQEGLAVTVADDGVGPPSPGSGPGSAPGSAPESHPGHHGLSGMRGRASLAGGEFSIAARPQGGTTVAFWLPDGPSGEPEDLA